jgi:hypothetical protein
MMPFIRAAVLAAAASSAAAGPLGKAKDAVDPDCTPAKAAKGAAQRAVVGVGNRCDVGETARDVTGVDGKKPKEAAADAARPKTN